MDRALNGRTKAIGLALELVPAAVFNFAVAFSVATVLRRLGLGEQAAIASVGAGVAAFLLAWRLLHRLGRAQRYALPLFETPSVDAGKTVPVAEDDELLLTERCDSPPAAVVRLVSPERATREAAEQQHGGELLLDDIVRKLEPDARVVRLFDPASMPTAGELSERIDRHLRFARRPSPPRDATDELHEALAQLRRSLH